MTDEERYLSKLQSERLKDRRQARGRRRTDKSGISPLQNLLKDYFKKDPELQTRYEEHSALTAWPAIVGEAAGRVSQPLRIRNQILVVHVDDVLWLQQLTFLKTSLLRHYQKHFPTLRLKDIYFTHY